jgi:ureidoacrylate peracid hydrolase
MSPLAQTLTDQDDSPIVLLLQRGASIVTPPETLARLKERVVPGRAAVLVIDMQNDFVSPKGKMAEFGFEVGCIRETIPRIRGLLDACRKRGIPVIHTLMINDIDQNPRSWHAFWGAPAVALPGTWGAEHIEELRPLEGEIVLVKYTYGAFTGTNLDTILRRRGIETVLVTGTDLNICAGDTLHQAFATGYHVVAVSDCLACFSRRGRRHAEELGELGLYLVENHFGIVADSVLVIGLMGQSG